MKTKTILGLTIGLLAFLAPLLIAPESLSLAGRINLGIFLMAATFWVLEPIPIYATSVVVILLLVLGLSAQGPFAQFTQPKAISPQATEIQNTWEVPVAALRDDQIYLQTARGWQSVEVQVLAPLAESSMVAIQTSTLTADSPIAANAKNWQLTFQAPSYAIYLGTLASPIIILFLGGFILAAGAVKYELDRNLCRIILKPFGTRPGAVLFGLMLVTALLSGFMSNTATTVMMMAVILPIVASSPESDRFRVGLALCIPFAANVGGILTPIGTPPNAIAINALISQGIAMPFTKWMFLTAPLVLVMLAFIWLLLLRLHPCSIPNLPLKMKGSFSRQPKACVLYIVFGLTILFWVTESAHGVPSGLIAFMPVALLPAFGVIEQKDIRSLPWEVLWLMAGGIALGLAMDQTGLATWMVELVPWANLGVYGILATFALVAILLATFIANTVAATLLIPIMMTLVSSGVAEGFAVQTAALTVALGASLGMSLPISTPPNAIAMSTGLINSGQMIRAGAVVGVVGYLVVLLSAFLFWSNWF